jgi:hypothetical protein
MSPSPVGQASHSPLPLASPVGQASRLPCVVARAAPAKCCRRVTRHGFAFSIALALLAAGALGQPTDSPVGAPGTPSTPPARRVPTLDELLGLEPAPARGDSAGAPDPAQAALDRQLTGAQAQDRFRLAVELMGESARRLGDARDTGLGTQRMQESVLRALDELIQSQQQGGGQSQQQQQQQQEQNAPQQPQSAQQNAAGDGTRQDEGPARADGALNTPLDSARAAWGALPERLRGALVQGTNDPFSSLYRAMTEQYYRRLAEDRR